MEDIYILSDYAIKNKIGEKIRATRLKQNITQQSLADSAEISLSAIKKIEKGDIKNFDSFLKVMRILGKLDSFQSLVEPDQLSPNEYFELQQSVMRKERKRARGKLKTQLQTESEW